ncbi:precorrin-2 C(20)-methyltransferase [Deinococcus maricopensis]|uniref:Precorrin-2 C20-methyltransferase n=1 Tax=Deinococcus maricopensis (strain DSM 21211 / LMG 22137 / NRRL B-23946 / LB-34) TaxID=709986 RepID=E8U431_DEIML|nr:precorrin-2 C(20)-methyltransferase [Deinococcus maricopensis]ADV65868.1 precorrin-2 C20-methyltransferase [Deinococcus maricopensis DSM 21211]
MTPEPTRLGTFYGVGVGPGPHALLPVAALRALQGAGVIYTPRAAISEDSVARHCLRDLDLPEDRYREVEFQMRTDPADLARQYAALAAEIAVDLRAGRDVAYLTIGDSMTYSTYGYTLAAIRELLPDAPRVTFPGVTSYAAAASALEFPLGEGKERVLILPCPDDMDALRADILTHDIVVLMKIGHRFPQVLALLHDLNIAQHCALAARIGLPGETLQRDVTGLQGERLGYLSTLLIRRAPRAERGGEAA